MGHKGKSMVSLYTVSTAICHKALVGLKRHSVKIIKLVALAVVELNQSAEISVEEQNF